VTRAGCIAAVLAFALAPRAYAQPEPSADGGDVEANAKQLYEDASKHYDLRDYAVAIDLFKKAYALLPEPLFLFDIAQSYRQLHDCDNARSFYKTYLRNAPTAENRDKVERFLAEMEQCVRDAPADQTNHVTERVTPPGGTGGATTTTDPGHTARLAGLITGGIGVLAIGAGVGFSIDATNQANAFQLQCLRGCQASQVLSIDAEGRNANTGAIVGYVVGGLAVATGVGLYLFGRHAEPVAVTPTAGGGMVTTMVRF
jgi:tetratricopeptide (TPR) repeat protein